MTTSNAKIKVRIAPSPTGYLHIGTARTALFNWVFARQNNGIFILRIEDTDKKRSKNKYKKDIINGLKWLGLHWDEEYLQSKRAKIYKEYLQKLQNKNYVYEKDNALWLKVPDTEITFNDIIRGSVKFDMSLIDDFVIAKSMDEVLYNFACVVDDYEMGITHIIRGEDHISNTPRQILIQQALGFETPIYAHLPLILGKDKSKLSKRHNAISLSSYKKDYLPEALINYLALLGWHPKKDREVFSKKELIKEFDINKVQKSGAIFEIEKLDWINGKYIKKTKNHILSQLTGLPESIIQLEKERARKLSDFKTLTKFIYKLPKYDKNLLIWKNTSLNKILSNLQEIKAILQNHNRGEAQKILLSKEDRGAYLWPLRVALSGLKASPSPFEIIQVLGIKETVKRIEKAEKKLQK